MEKLRQLVSDSREALKRADYLAYTTYPQIREIKLLYVIAENLYKAAVKAMEAVLCYERMYKRLPLIPGAFDYELELFKDRCIDRYNLDRGAVLLIRDLKSLIEFRKRSPIEFARKDKFVICSDDYRMKVLDLQKIKMYLADTKMFVERVQKVLRC